MENLMVTLNKNENNYKDFQEVKPKAFEQMLEVYNNLCSFLNTCVTRSNTSNIKEQLEVFIDRLRHNNFFDDYSEVDNNVFDMLYLNRDVNAGELDECTLTVLEKDDTIEVSKYIEIGIKGEDYPMSVNIDDVVYTLNQLASSK